MIVAGFDQAPRAIAFCVGEPGASNPRYGIRENPDFGDNTGLLFVEIKKYWKPQILFWKPRLVFVEQVLVRKFGFDVNVFTKQVIVQTALEVACAELKAEGLLDVECYVAMIGDWRTAFHAGARPPKNAASQTDVWKDLARVECARRGWLIEDHNIAEACGIWDYGCEKADKVYRMRRERERQKIIMKRDNDRQAGLA